MSNRRHDTLPKTSKNASGGSASQRRVSRREREDKQRKQLYIGLGIAAILSIAIVAGFALNEYLFKPRTVLASVNGEEIRRRDYWKVRSVDLVNQINQYNQFSQMVDASQSQQYITLAQQASDELDEVWGSTSTDEATLTRMVEDQVYLQSLEGMGLAVTDQDVQNYINSQFEPSNAPIFTPTPSPTLIPQRAEWATQTEVALRAEGEEPTEEAGSPDGADGSPVAIASPIDGSPVAEASPVAASPIVDASPVVGSPITEASPIVASPVVEASPAAASPIVDGSPIAASPIVDASPVVGSPATDASPVVGSPVVDASPVVASPVVDASPVVGSPVIDASPVVGSPVIDASPVVVSPVVDASPAAASPVVDASPVDGSPVTEASPADGSPESLASPVGSPEATSTIVEIPTPDGTQAIQTAEAGFENYQDVVFDIAHMSESDYERLIARPAVARQTIEGSLLQDVGQSTQQVHASHILVDTKDLADSIYAQLQGGADFAETAKTQSNDTATAENGGDLGWFTKGQMVEPFENVVFAMAPGEVSTPFQTQFGWHIVNVLETDPDRAMTDQQLQTYKDSIISRWLTAQQATMNISSEVEPTPTPALSSFVPPPDAPPLPTPTIMPTEPPLDASPVGSPVASPIGSPLASPIASPEASPAT